MSILGGFYILFCTKVNTLIRKIKIDTEFHFNVSL